MKEKIITLLLCTAFVVTAGAQIEKHRKLSDKVFFGGNIGLQFGTVTYVELSPLAGYLITKNWLVAAGPGYQYYRDNRYQNTVFETSLYGGRIMSRYLIMEQLFVEAEYEFLNCETKYFDRANLHSGKKRFWIHTPLAGFGYRQSLGESAVHISVLFDVLENKNSPYINPIVRVGFEL